MRPIAFFDSGIGGLSVLAAAKELLPGERFVYYGDSGRAPYGERTAGEIFDYTVECVLELMHLDIKALVLACNTATSVTVETLRSRLEIPVISMEPAIKPAFAMRKKGRVAVMATPATLDQPRFLNLLQRFDPKRSALLLPCSDLVGLIEEGDFEAPKIEACIEEVFTPHVGAAIDAVVLGCTHFVLVEETVQRVCQRLFPGAKTVHGNEGTVRHLARVLGQRGLLSEGAGEGGVEFYSSGDANRLRDIFLRIAGAKTRT